MAAHARRRPCYASNRNGRARGRVRHRVREPDRCRPVSRQTHFAISTRPRVRNCVHCQVTTQSSPMPCAIHTWSSESRPPLRGGAARRPPTAGWTGDDGWRPATLSFEFPGIAPQRAGARAGRQRARLVTIRAERDGIVRRVPIVMQAQGTVMPSLTLEMLRVVSGATPC